MTDVLEQSVSEVLVQGVVLVREVRHQQVEVTILIEISCGDTHSCLPPPLPVVTDSGTLRGILKPARPIVDEERIGVLIVSEIQIEPAIVIQINRDDPPTGESGPVCGIAKRAIAVAKIEHVGLRLHGAGSAERPNALLAVAAEFVRSQSPFGIVAGIQVEVAVVVRVEESRTRSPASIRDARTRGDGLERAVAEISIQQIAAEARHVQVGKPVVVDVSAGDPGVESEVFESCLHGDVFKLPVAEVAVTAIAECRSSDRLSGFGDGSERCFKFGRQWVGGREEQVSPAIAVKVERPDPASVRCWKRLVRRVATAVHNVDS